MDLHKAFSVSLHPGVSVSVRNAGVVVTTLQAPGWWDLFLRAHQRVERQCHDDTLNVSGDNWVARPGNP